MGQQCYAGKCQGPDTICKPKVCDMDECCIGTQCLKPLPASLELWLDWTSLRETATSTVWLDRSRHERQTASSPQNPKTSGGPATGKPSLLELDRDPRHIEVKGLGKSIFGDDGFLLLFAGSQRCEGVGRPEAQCAVSRMSPEGGLYVCIAGSASPRPEIDTCEDDDNPRTCTALVAAPTQNCGTIELLTVRRWTPASDPAAQPQLEIRRDGRQLATEPNSGSMLDSNFALRIGGSPSKRRYSGNVALVALFSGNFDEPSMCRLEHFVLASLKAVGLRESFDLPETCD